MRICLQCSPKPEMDAQDKDIGISQSSTARQTCIDGAGALVLLEVLRDLVFPQAVIFIYIKDAI